MLPGEGPYVLLADAMLKRIRGQWWTVYFTAVKMPGDTHAVLLPPVVQAGRECPSGWRAALNAIPDAVAHRVAVLVCDGSRGLVHYGWCNGWHIQRCQAHLLFAIAGRRSRSRWSRHREEAHTVHQLTRTILHSTDTRTVQYAVNALEACGWETASTQLTYIISGFLRSVEQHRTCLHHPEWDVPATNNAMECFIGQFQELCRRARGFSSPEALTRWANAFVKHKQWITCNGFHQPNSSR